jgi:hypothetical protein
MSMYYEHMNDFTLDTQRPTTSDFARPEPTLTGSDGQRPTLSSVRREEHNLTTREALQLFETAGLPRNQRSIERYCADGKLDAFFDSDEQRYFISRASVERLIGHLQEIKARHEAVGVVSPARSDGIRPAATLPRHEPDVRQPEAEHPRIQELEGEVATLKSEIKNLEEKHFTVSYEKKASEQMVTMMREQIKEDRKEFFQQMDKLVKEMGETKQLVGQLETQLKQIAAPTPHGPSGATTGMRQIMEAAVVEDIPPTTDSDMLPASSQQFRPTVADVRESSAEGRV